MAKPTLKTETKTIGDVTVHMEQLRPKKALRVSAVLARFLLPIFGAIDPKAEVTQEVLTGALMGIASGMDPDTIDKLADELLTSTIITADGEPKYDLSIPGKVDEAFEGRFGTFIEVLQMAIRMNFAEHFGAVGLKGQPTPTTAR